MTTMFYDRDADVSLIQAKRVAILGFGSQGHAHALNLHDSGVQVRVGLSDGSRSRATARTAGLTVCSPAEACGWADVIVVLVPDTAQPSLYARDIAPSLTPGKLLMFAHGFNIRFGTIAPPSGVDVAMVAPKSPGHRVRDCTSRVAALQRCWRSIRTRQVTRAHWPCRTRRPSARREQA